MTFLYANRLKLCMRMVLNVGDSNCRRNAFHVCESTKVVVSAKRPLCMPIDGYSALEVRYTTSGWFALFTWSSMYKVHCATKGFTWGLIQILQTLHALPIFGPIFGQDIRLTWSATRHLLLDALSGRLDQSAFYCRRPPRAPNKRYSAVSTAQHLSFLPQLLLTYGPPDLITSFNHQTAKILQQHPMLLAYYNSP